MTMRILVLYYSQSGDVTRAVNAFVEPLAASGAGIVWENLRPKTAYPSPWRSLTRFFGVMPDCVLGRCSGNRNPSGLMPANRSTW